MQSNLFAFIVLFSAAIEVSSGEKFENDEWQAFKLEYSKMYNNESEELLRMTIFMENQNKIANHNQRYANGEISFKLAMNKFGDLTRDEFVTKMNGFNRISRAKLNETISSIIIDNAVYFVEPANVELPSSVDWRNDGAVTPVKDQGDECGSCWAFSATGALEAQHFRKTGRLVSLSQQNLMDCSSVYGNEGCDGGLMDQAFQYIKDNGGIDTEKSYPYKATENACKFKKRTSAAIVNGFVNIPEGNEKKLVAAIATVGPISVGIDASHESFQFYSTGIYYEPKCHRRSDELDHAVLAVGYGTEKRTRDYYIVKNSYGTDWGIRGYIKMARNRKNMCGIATEATYPLV